MQIGGLILAGGMARRMGGMEKTFLEIGGASILRRIVRALAQQCDPLAISTNIDAARFEAYGLVAIPDVRMRGPMVGLALGLDWFARQHPKVTHVLSVPGDTPFLPHDLAARLSGALEEETFCACAASAGQRHPVIGLWPMAVRPTLHAAAAQDRLSFRAALDGQRVAEVEWPAAPCDPFFNVNSPDDLACARSQCQADLR